MKTKKIILGLGSFVTVAAPIATVISCGTNSEVLNSVYKNNTETAQTPSIGNSAVNLSGLNGSNPVIKESSANNLRNFEESIKPKSVGVWQPDYKVRSFDNMLVRQWYQNAVNDGWQSIDDYQMYQQYVYEVGGKATKASNMFGVIPSNSNCSWIGFYYGPGNDLPFSTKQAYNFGGDWKANVSEMSPVWSGASKETWNHIDNEKKWYHYEGGDALQFLFDEDNKENAVKRLINMKRLKKVDLSQVMNEKDAGNHIRNYIMLDGQLYPSNNLPFGNYNMYYVNHTGDLTDDDAFVRDDNGWKVVVSDRDLDKMLSGVTNPTSQATITAHSEIKTTAVSSALTLYSGAERQEAKIIDYPADYNENAAFNMAHKYSADLNKTDVRYFIGRYSITEAADTFEKLMDNPLVHMPYKDVRGEGDEFTDTNQQKTDTMPNRFGRTGKYHDIYGNDELHHYAWAWVEDGNGGHKIWKSAKRIRHVLDLWADGTDQRIASQLSKLAAQTGLTKEQLKSCKGHGDYRFYGSFERIYPVKEWFTQSEYVTSDMGV